MLSPICPACLVQGTAERPTSGDRRVTSCTASRGRPLVKQVGQIDFRADDYLRLPRRRWMASFECAALAMISPALRAKPLSSTGATSALDFNERFAGLCRSSEKTLPFLFFRQWTIRPLASLTQTPAPELSFHVLLSRSMEWTCQFEHSSKSTIGPRLGRKILRIWRQHSRPH